MKLDHFLRLYPNFHFDLAEHLEATKHITDLLRRLERARAWATECREAQASTFLGSSSPAMFESSWPTRGTGIMTKDMLRADSSHYLKDIEAQSSVWGKWTSGTTGAPILIPYAAEFYFDQLYLPLVRAAVFIDADIYRQEIFALSFTDNRSSAEFVLSDPTATVGLSLQVVLRESAEASVRRAWDLLEKLRPAVLTVKPVILEALLRAAPTSVDLTSVKFIFCSGSILNENLRQKTETTFGLPVLNGYGLTEFGIMGFECAQRSLHYDPVIFQVETVTTTGDPTGLNRPGIITVTTRTNPLLPLRRYCTGDVAVAASTPCPCGRHGPRLTQLTGRIQSCFLGKSGELLSPIHFRTLFDRVPIREYQVIQEAPGSLLILVEPLPTAMTDSVIDSVWQQLRGIVSDRWKVAVEVTNLPDDPGFQRHYVNLRPQQLPSLSKSHIIDRTQW